MMIQLGGGGGGGGGGGEDNIIFQCLSADCKVVHEFIGNYFTERSFTEKTNKMGSPRKMNERNEKKSNAPISKY